MTKKHFIALADMIRDQNRFGPVLFDRTHLEMMAAFCRMQNPLFNRERWLAYIAGECGPGGGRMNQKEKSK